MSDHPRLPRLHPQLFDAKLLRNTIGDVLCRARKAKGWTQEDVGDQVQVTCEFYARVERGDILPGLQTAIRLAHVLGLEFDVLLGLKPLDTSAITPDPDSRTFRKLARRLRRIRPVHRRLLGRVLDGLEAAEARSRRR